MSESHSTDFARQLELAWAAGFFDGEGSTYLYRRSNRPTSYLKTAVAQVEPEPLRKFFEAVGHGNIYGPYSERKSSRNAQPIYKWVCSGFPAKDVLKLLWPYLSEVKKRQALAVISLENNSGKIAARYRTHCPKGHEYAVHAFYRKDGGGRRCRICLREQNRLKMRQWRAKRKRQAKEEANDGGR